MRLVTKQLTTIVDHTLMQLVMLLVTVTQHHMYHVLASHLCIQIEEHMLLELVLLQAMKTVETM